MCSDDAQNIYEKKQFLKKGDKSRKIYDPQQALIKQNQEKKDLKDKLEKH